MSAGRVENALFIGRCRARLETGRVRRAYNQTEIGAPQRSLVQAARSEAGTVMMAFAFFGLCLLGAVVVLPLLFAGFVLALAFKLLLLPLRIAALFARLAVGAVAFVVVAAVGFGLLAAAGALVVAAAVPLLPLALAAIAVLVMIRVLWPGRSVRPVA